MIRSIATQFRENNLRDMQRDMLYTEHSSNVQSFHMTMMLLINNREHSIWPWKQKRLDREFFEMKIALHQEFNRESAVIQAKLDELQDLPITMEVINPFIYPPSLLKA